MVKERLMLKAEIDRRYKDGRTGIRRVGETCTARPVRSMSKERVLE